MTRVFDLRNLESDHEYICTDDVCVSLSDCLRVRGAMCSASSEKKDQEPNRTSHFAVFLKDKRNITLDFRGAHALPQGRDTAVFSGELRAYPNTELRDRA